MRDEFEIPFVNACIRAIGRRLNRPVVEAFNYIDKYKGLDFLVDYYSTLHLQSIEDTVDDVLFYCKNNGGKL